MYNYTFDNPLNKINKYHGRNILIIDRDIHYARVVTKYFQDHQFAVTAVTSFEESIYLYGRNAPDLIISSIVATREGVCIARALYKYNFKGKFIVFSNLNMLTEQEIINYLEAGANDVVDKSIRLRILLAKVHGILGTVSVNSRLNKKFQVIEESHEIIIGALRINKSLGKVVFKEQVVELSKNELRLLIMLVENKNETISRDNLHQSILNTEYDGLNRSIDNTISRIRKKMGVKNLAQLKIKSIRGKGYIFSPD